MKEIKIRILDEDHCKEVQRALFEQGAKWGIGKEIKHLNSRWIFCNRSKSLSYSDKFNFGLKHYYKEITLSELLNKGEVQYEIY